MTPDEPNELLGRRLEHQNKVRGIGLGELPAPLPFARCHGGPGCAWREVCLVECANVEVGEGVEIFYASFAKHEITDDHGRWRDTGRACNRAAEATDEATEVHVKSR